MRLYNGNFSPNALRVRAVIYELGVDIEKIEVDVRSGGNRTPEFLKLNPNGKVPVLVDGDLIIWESRAINACLASKYPERGLYPADLTDLQIDFDGKNSIIASHPDLDIATFRASSAEITSTKKTVLTGFQSNWPPAPPHNRTKESISPDFHRSAPFGSP
jgi:hypothetical protein